MPGFVLERRQRVPAPLQTVFAFFKDPYNLSTITPPWLHFQVRSATDNPVREGTRIRYRLRWHIFPMRWESRITEYREGEAFADEMLVGPYRSWYHRHRFRSVEGGVEVFDRVEYALRFGPLGRLAHALVVRKQLEEIFAYRARRIAALFAPPAATGSA